MSKKSFTSAAACERFVDIEQNCAKHEMADDELEISRISGININPDAYIAALTDAMVVHQREVGDDARLSLEPITIRDIDYNEAVSGYRSVHLTELVHSGASEAFFARKLCDVELEDVEYEAIWALGKVIVFYIRGRPTLA